MYLKRLTMKGFKSFADTTALDLEPGVVRVKAGGGLAGHNGLRSINEHVKSQDFVRVRIGIGKPPTKEQGADHVLAKFSAKDRAAFDVAVAIAADATQVLVAEGVEAAMQRFNSR